MADTLRIGTMVPGGNGSANYIKQIVPYGFESFELTFGQAVAEDCDLAKVADDIAKVLDGTGAVVSALGVYGNPLEGREVDEQTRKSWYKLIDNADRFGAKVVAGFTGRLIGKPIPDSIPKFKEFFAPLADYAGSKGLDIAFENCDMGGSWQAGDWNIAHNPSAWELMFEAVPVPNFGLEWEPCHQMVSLIDPMPQLREWVKRILHLHGKDATILWDVVRKYGFDGPKQFAFHRTPGFGDSNWVDIISELRRGGYKGAIDIEGWHDPVYRGELEMTGQVAGLNYLKRCRGGSFVPNPQ